MLNRVVLLVLASLVLMSTTGITFAYACDGFEGSLRLQLSHFEEEGKWINQSNDETTARVATQVGCPVKMSRKSGFMIDLYGEYDTAADESWFDPYNLHFYRDLAEFTFTVGFQQKPMGYMETEQPNGLYNPKSYREGPFNTRSLGRFAVGALYRQESWLLHIDLMPLKQHDLWPDDKGRFRRGGFIVQDSVYESGSDVSSQVKLDYFGDNFELSGMLWRGFSPQPIVQASSEQPGEVVDYYPFIQQAGLSAVYLLNDISLKSDIFYRSSSSSEVGGISLGMSWYLYNVLDGLADVTLYLEGYYIEEHDGGPDMLASSFDNDAYIGARFNLHDAASSEIEFGLINDVKWGSVSGYFELTQTLHPQIKYELGIERFLPDSSDMGQVGFADDSHVYINVFWYL